MCYAKIVVTSILTFLIFLPLSVWADDLSAPTALTSVADQQHIALTWVDNSPNELGFRVERQTDNDGAWVHVATTDANVTTYKDTAIIGHTYCYRVNAFINYFSDYTNTACLTLPSVTTPPDAPTAATLGTNMVLTWTGVRGAVGYHIICSARPTESFSPEKGGEVPGHMTVFHVNKVRYSTDPAWRASCAVQAWNSYGPSPLSNVAKVPQ